MMEAGVLINLAGDPIHWHLPPGRTIVALPDSRDLWGIFWDNRKDTLGFAHSHPGGGVPYPSGTDLTTFAAIEAGLGKRLQWWVTSSEAVVVCTWAGPGKFDYEVVAIEEPHWAPQLRGLSDYQ